MCLSFLFNINILGRSWACVLLGLAVPLGVHAQPTNVEVFQQLAVQCLETAPDTVRAFRLEAPSQMPYLQSMLLERWQNADRLVFVADTARFDVPDDLPLFGYSITQVGLTYTRQGRKQLRRDVTLDLHYRLTAANGQVLSDQSCTSPYTDTVARNAAKHLSDPSYPETLAPIPAGWLRRYLEPAVLTAATAVTVYLFFNLRSTSSGDS